MKKMNSKQISYTSIETKSFLEEYEKRKDVDCIYLLSHEEKDYNEFDLVIVFNDGISKRTETRFNKLNNLFKKEDSINSFGGRLSLVADENTNYSMLASNASEIKRVRDLLSSQILYDKDGLYKKIAHQFDSYRIVEPYSNSFEIKLK